MSSRTLSYSLAIAAAFAAPLAHANGDGFKWIGGEAGVVFEPVPSTVTRSQVKQELDAARRDGTLRLSQRERSYAPTEMPRAGFADTREQAKQAAQLRERRPNDGWRYIGGEGGWVFDGR